MKSLKKRVVAFLLSIAMVVTCFSGMSLDVHAGCTSTKCEGGSITCNGITYDLTGAIKYSGDYENCYVLADGLTLIITGYGTKIPSYYNGAEFVWYKSRINSVIFADNVKVAKSHVLCGRTDIRYIDFNNITSVEEYAFSGCSGLTSVNMPNVTSIGKYAFNECTSLISVDMPKVTSIGEYSFYYDDSLISVNMPATKSIGKGAFQYCDNLRNINLPSVSSTINYDAFLVRNTVNTKVTYSDSSESYVTSYSWGSSRPFVSELEPYCAVKDNTVVSFDGDSTSLYTEWDENAKIFQWMISTDNGINWAEITGATDQTLNLSALTYEMTGYQYKCVATNETLTGESGIFTLDVREPEITCNGTTYSLIGAKEFKNEYGSCYVLADGLTLIVTGWGTKTPDSLDVSASNSYIYYPWQRNEVRYPYWNTLEKIVFADDVTDIEYGAFRCPPQNLISVESSGIQSINGDYAFQSIGMFKGDFKSNLQQVSFPALKKIDGQYAFAYLDKLDAVYLPLCESINGVETFIECYSLSSISLPSLTTIEGSYSFDKCTALTSVSMPLCESIGGNTFNRCTSLTSISLPSCTTIGFYAFVNCTGLTSVDIPACKEIKKQAFQYCSSLSNINMDNVETIGDSAFSSCSSLTTISLPKITNIGTYAFLVSKNTPTTVIYSDVSESLLKSYPWSTDKRTVSEENFILYEGCPACTGKENKTISVLAGEDTSLDTEWDENAKTFQWMISTDGGNTWTAITGETSKTLSLTDCTIDMNNNKYKCVATNDTKTGESGIFTLQVTNPSSQVSFDLDGGHYTGEGSLPTESVYGTELTLPIASVIKKDGYTFKGWKEAGDTTDTVVTSIPADNTTAKSFVAMWTPTSYSITYTNVDNTQEGLNNPVAYTVETEAITLKNPSKTGMTFTGWKETKVFKDSAPKTTYVIPKDTTGDLSFEAVFENKVCNVAYELGEGASFVEGYTPPQSHEYSTSATALPDSTKVVRTGYTFEGWYTNLNDEGTKTTSIPSGLAEDVTYYAKWSDPVHYALNLTLNGGTYETGKNNKSYYTIEDTKNAGFALYQPVKTGYEFLGWTTTETGSDYKKDYEVAQGTHDAITLYAQWKAVSFSVDVKFDGGSWKEGKEYDLTKTYGEELTLPDGDCIEKTGYTFGGWYTDLSDESTKIEVIPADDLTSDASYYVKWIAKTNIPYTVKHYQKKLNEDGYLLADTDDLTGTADATVTPSVKTYAGFTSPATQTVTIKPDGTTEVNYYYTRNSYTITVTRDDGFTSVSGSGTYEYQASVSLQGVLKDGYTFAKWEFEDGQFQTDNPYTHTAGKDESIRAVSQCVPYTIAYNLGGGTADGNPATYTVATESFTLKNPTRDGYTFLGWYQGDDSTNVKTTVTVSKGTMGNLAFTATWKKTDTTPPIFEVMDDHERGVLYTDRTRFVKVTVIASDPDGEDDDYQYMLLKKDGTTVYDWQEENSFQLAPQQGNGEYKVKVKDSSGNTEEKPYLLTAWDLESPAIRAEASPTAEELAYTRQRTVRIDADAGETSSVNVSALHIRPYLIEKKTAGYVPYTAVTAEMEQKFTDSPSMQTDSNGTYVAYVRDSAGNLSSAEVTVTGIDTSSPVMDYFTDVSSDKKTVIVGIKVMDSFGDGNSSISGMRKDKDGNYDCFETTRTDISLADCQMKENGWVYTAFKTRENQNFVVSAYDEAGNKTSTFICINAKRILEENAFNPVEDITLENTDMTEFPAFTSSIVKATVRLKDGCNMDDYEFCFDYRNYVAGKKDNGTGSWSKNLSKAVYRNGTYDAYVKDEFGFVYQKEFRVDNIDKTKPVVTATPQADGKIVIHASDDLSGIDHISVLGNSMESIREFTNLNGVLETDCLFDSVSGGTFSIMAYDMVGNVSSTVKVSIAGSNFTEEKPVKYKVTFRNYRNATIKTVMVEKHGNAVTPNSSMTKRAGYVFVGWNNSYMDVTSNVVLRPVYLEDKSKASETYYRVVFMDYDGTVLSAENVVSGGSAKAPSSSPEREGYTFNGWSTSFDAITQNLTIVAQYKRA